MGNELNRIPAAAGQHVDVVDRPGGTTLVDAGTSDDPTAVEVTNTLPNGSINAHIYRCGRLLTAVPAVPPGSTATVSLNDSIWVGVLDTAEPGEAVDTAVVTEAEEFSLDGLASADIALTGDGPPSQFRLEATK